MRSDSRPHFQQVQFGLTDWLRKPDQNPAPEGVELRRLQIYRELFFNNVTGFVENAFPILKRLLPAELWARLTAGFFADYRCQTPYFHEISHEFLQYLNSLDWPELEAYPWARELAHYEWVDIAADVAEAEAVPASIVSDGDLLAGIPCLNPFTWVLVYQWPVHRLEEYLPGVQLEAPVCLLVYRDQEERVQQMEINPLTAHLVEALRPGGATGRERLLALAEQAGYADAESFLVAGEGMLQELRGSGIILGVIAPPA